MKPYIVIAGPATSRSGYGDHTREIALSLIKADKYDVAIIATKWGACPNNALNITDSNDAAILNCILGAPMNRQPDIFIQISVPNEFQKVGKYNIGITAGIETTLCAAEWLQGCNNMDEIITTSEHSKLTFISTIYDRINEQTKQKEAELRLEKPISVLFEGIDLEVFNKTNELDSSVVDVMNTVKEDFAFLFVGHWLQGDIGQDRKDIGMLVKVFCEAFKNKSAHNKPALILKTSGATFSIIDREQCLNKIKFITDAYGDNAPSVYLIHGDLSKYEMNSLYNHPKVKAMVSFTKGEGFGRPLFEFGTTGKPIIASKWSGHLDFLPEDHCVLLPGELGNVHPSASWDKVILKESQWFTVNYGYALATLKDVHENYKTYLEKSRKQPHYIKTNFTFEKMAEKFVATIDKALESIPQPVQLKLPQLKKVELPKLTKV